VDSAFESLEAMRAQLHRGTAWSTSGARVELGFAIRGEVNAFTLAAMSLLLGLSFQSTLAIGFSFIPTLYWWWIASRLREMRATLLNALVFDEKTQHYFIALPANTVVPQIFWLVEILALARPFVIALAEA
jgi:hypothetical protein